jgi:hypothetical protein
MKRLVLALSLLIVPAAAHANPVKWIKTSFERQSGYEEIHNFKLLGKNKGTWTFSAHISEKRGGKLRPVRGTYDFKNLAQW